jgi:hypothetical protein
MRSTLPFALCLFALGCIVGHCVGCTAPPQATTAAQAAAEGAYSAALLRCVDEAKTLAESRACRAKVNAEWGVVEKETAR